MAAAEVENDGAGELVTRFLAGRADRTQQGWGRTTLDLSSFTAVLGRKPA